MKNASRRQGFCGSNLAKITEEIERVNSGQEEDLSDDQTADAIIVDQ